MSILQHSLVGLIQIYRWIGSPAKVFLFGPGARCRFDPSCSVYAADAIRSHGTLAGGWLALRRMGRCHPWGGCGCDPVPPARPEAGGLVHLPVTSSSTAIPGNLL